MRVRNVSLIESRLSRLDVFIHERCHLGTGHKELCLLQKDLLGGTNEFHRVAMHTSRQLHKGATTGNGDLLGCSTQGEARTRSAAIARPTSTSRARHGTSAIGSIDHGVTGDRSLRY